MAHKTKKFEQKRQNTKLNEKLSKQMGGQLRKSENVQRKEENGEDGVQKKRRTEEVKLLRLLTKWDELRWVALFR